jgi:hypothetical protein
VLASPPCPPPQFADFRTGHLAGDRRETARKATRTPVLLAAALLALVLYAAFSHGAVGSPAEARLQVVLAGIAAVAGGAWLWSGTLRFSAPRCAVAGIGLLSAFALWSAVTLLWSVAPDNTWLELNRVLTYVIVLVLAVVLGASTKRAVGLISEGFVLVATAVTLYGLGQKLVPGLHIGGLFDLNQTGALPRLQEPLGYWNALALLLALGAPVALMITVDTGRSVRTRLAALAGLQLMLLAIGFTYSRGGVLALAVGLAVAIGLGGAWVRSLVWLGVAVVAALPALLFGLLSHALTAAKVDLGTREGAGGVLTAILIVSLLALVVTARRLVERERAFHLGPERTRTIARVLLTGLGCWSWRAFWPSRSPREALGGPSHTRGIHLPPRGAQATTTPAGCCRQIRRTAGCGGRKPPEPSAIGPWGVGGPDRSRSLICSTAATRCRWPSPTAFPCSGSPSRA